MNHEQYLKLVNELRRYAYNYYVLDQSDISDAEYDLLFQRLLTWEENNPDMVHPHSPTLRVAGGSRAIGVLYPHRVPMLSIGNIFDYADFDRWLRGVVRDLGHRPQLLLEFKYDGLAVSIIYENGELVRALTRNDGQQGEDVTENVLAIGSIPVTIEGEFNGEIRGEVVIPRDVFERLNDSLIAAGQRTYANPRNAAAGMLRRGKVDVVTNLAFIPYGVIEYDTDEYLNAMTYLEQREWLKEVCPCLIDALDPTMVMDLGEADELHGTFAEMLKRFDALRADFPVETDGAVIKTNRPEDTRALGHGNRIVHWATAYKFNALNRKTTLLDVTFQVGRTGLVTPVAELEPVELNGVVVTRATMHNVEMLEAKETRVGYLVAIERAGDVIPAITDIIPVENISNPVIRAPTHCPCCDTKLTTGRNSNGIYCPNVQCPDRRTTAFLYATNRDGLDVKGLGEVTVKQILTRYPSLTLQELFKLTPSQVQACTDLSELEAKKLCAELDDKSHTTMARALKAAGIEALGRTGARQIAEHYAGKNLTMEQVTNAVWLDVTPGSSQMLPERLANIINADTDARRKLSEVEFLSLVPDVNTLDEFGVKDDRIKGKGFAVTGSVPGYTRDHIANHLRAAGGVFKSGVSKATDFLFYGHDAGGKLTKARELGIQCIDLTDPTVMQEWIMLLDIE